MWLQGDHFRRKCRDRIVMGTKSPFPIYSLKLKDILTEEVNKRLAKSDPNFTRSVAAAPFLRHLYPFPAHVLSSNRCHNKTE